LILFGELPDGLLRDGEKLLEMIGLFVSADELIVFFGQLVPEVSIFSLKLSN